MSDVDVSVMDMGVEYGDQISEDPFDDVVEEGDFTEDQALAEEVEDSSEIEEPTEEDADQSQIEPDEGEESEEESSEEVEEPSEESEEEVPEDRTEEDGPVDYQARVDEFNKQLEEGSLEVQINDDESVLLKDLKNDFIGQKEISKRFTELDVKNKQLEADTSEINTYIDEFAGILKSGDAVGAMSYFGNFAGVPPHMVKEQLIAALAPEIMRRQGMSELEIQSEYQSSEIEHMKNERETDMQRSATEQTQRDLQSDINHIRETQSINEDEWDTAVSELQAQESNEALTPELVSDYVKYGRNYEQAASVVESFGDQIENKDQWQEDIVDMKEKYPDFTDQDIKEVVETALKDMKTSAAEKKLTSKLEAKKAPVKQTQTKQAQSVEEEIDPDLEDWL